MDSKALLGLSIVTGAVVAGGVYNFIYSDTAIKISVGGGLLAGGVKLLHSYAKGNAARWAISAGAGVVAALLIPTINWFISSFRGSAKSQQEKRRANIDLNQEPVKIDFKGKGTVEAYYYDENGKLSLIRHYNMDTKEDWIAELELSKEGGSQHDRIYDTDGKLLYDPLYDKNGARLVSPSGKFLYLDMSKYDKGKRLSYNPQAK